MRVAELDLPKRASRKLAARNIVSLGELLLTPGQELLGRSFNNGTLAKTRAVVDEFLRKSLSGELSVDVDWHTPHDALHSLLRPVLSDKRQRTILLERMGWRSEPRTLEELAREFGVTRESFSVKKRTDAGEGR
ncbi:MAG: hypothetical protein HUU20_09020 [Pirellulales bacterium]|nr:hypothetical protein [Pirellulales bacterium]